MRQVKVSRKPYILEESFNAQYLALGLCMGTGFGIIAGLAVGNLALGLSLGAGLGLSIGMLPGTFKKHKGD